MPPLKSHTAPLTEDQAGRLQDLLQQRGFTFEARPYTRCFAQKPGLVVAVYEKGPKVVVQGRETEDFVRFTLEPEILGEARLGYEETHHPERYQPHFGIDESGKGDFFGPLVIAGAYVDGPIARHLLEQGIRDSKSISSDARIRQLAEVIRRTPGLVSRLVVVPPARYNALHAKMGNLNRLLAWGHARVIEDLATAVPGCPSALSDQFANPRLVERALMERGRRLEMRQQTKAESDPAVAAASILAREAFVGWLDEQGRRFGLTLPKGASMQVKQAARQLVQSHGVEALPGVAKMHFKTAAEVLDASAEAGGA